jgi:hypothetical protein
VPQSVEVAGREVSRAVFEGRRARLPELLVPAAAVLPDAKKARDRFLGAPEDMFFTVSLRGEVKTRGRGLLTVRVGFESAGTVGSLMHGRCISID